MNCLKIFLHQACPAIDTFQHLSPLAGGGFTVSYISFQTLFKKTNPNQISKRLMNFRVTVS